jgi:hypothetical protein
MVQTLEQRYGAQYDESSDEEDESEEDEDEDEESGEGMSSSVYLFGLLLRLNRKD